MADQEVKVILKGVDQTGDSFKLVGQKMKGLDTDVSGLAKTIGGASLAIGGLAIAFGVDTVKSAIASQNAIAQLNAVLKSTGGVSGQTIDSLTKTAAALQSMTTYSDEAIESAQGLLLTFTGIKGPIFEEATKTVLDMSTALGQDLKSSSIQLGKALQDPILGITALRRVGVNFNDTQKDIIKTMVESGDVIGAQKLILKELSLEFGGSAAAAGETFAGKMAIITNQVDDMKESIGGAIIEAITPFINDLSTWAANPDVQKKVGEIAKGVGEFAQVVLPIAIETIKLWYKAWQTVVEVLGTIIYSVQVVIEKIEKAIDAIGRFKDKVAGGISSGVSNFISNVSAGAKAIVGAKADGGPVMGGYSYLVGERGPEIFTPSGPGNITPNGGMGGITINITGNTLLDSSAGEKIANQIMKTLKNNLRI